MALTQTPTTQQPQTPSKSPSPLVLPPASSKKMLLIVGIVVLALVLVATVLVLNQKSTKKATPTTTQNVVAGAVDITAQGFNPATIKIKVGQNVVWTNRDTAAHQPATDPYPAENGLAGFVAPAPLQRSDSYSFTFHTAGTYTYHDHLNPLQLKATVIVQ